jgi:hypothetical protein
MHLRNACQNTTGWGMPHRTARGGWLGPSRSGGFCVVAKVATFHSPRRGEHDRGDSPDANFYSLTIFMARKLNCFPERNYFLEIIYMEKTKIEPDAADLSIGDATDISRTASDKEASFQDDATDPPWRSNRSHHGPWRQFQFGPPLASGYAPESVTPASAPGQRREPQAVAPSRPLSPNRHSPGEKKIVKSAATGGPEIKRELAEVRSAWQLYRSSHDRNAVYLYLEAVFNLVTRWQRLHCAMKNSRAALRRRSSAPNMKPEPFARVIFCTCDLAVADARMRSKWSRVLRFAQNAKPADQHLADFIKANGGLNGCARRFAAQRKLHD